MTMLRLVHSVAALPDGEWREFHRDHASPRRPCLWCQRPTSGRFQPPEAAAPVAMCARDVTSGLSVVEVEHGAPGGAA